MTMANHPLDTHRWKALPVALALLFSFVGIPTTSAQERIYFPSRDNAEAQIVSRINAETVRLDIGMWLLNDGAITTAIINRHLAGVPVRVLGDRASIFESDRSVAWSAEEMSTPKSIAGYWRASEINRGPGSAPALRCLDTGPVKRSCAWWSGSCITRLPWQRPRLRARRSPHLSYP